MQSFIRFILIFICKSIKAFSRSFESCETAEERLQNRRAAFPRPPSSTITRPTSPKRSVGSRLSTINEPPSPNRRVGFVDSPPNPQPNPQPNPPPNPRQLPIRNDVFIGAMPNPNEDPDLPNVDEAVEPIRVAEEPILPEENILFISSLLETEMVELSDYNEYDQDMPDA